MLVAAILSLSIALGPRFVNGVEPPKTSTGVHASTSTYTFELQIQETLANGIKKDFGGITRFPEIPKGSPVRRRMVSGKDTLDDHRRWFTVILDISTSTVKPTFVELFVEEIDLPASKSNVYYHLLGLNGTLKQCGVAFGPLDESGKLKLGPALAPFKYLDNDSPETRARLKRELDFWLKGIGRKSPDQKPETSKDGKSP